MNIRRILGLKTRELLKMPFPRKERERIFLEMCNYMISKPNISLAEPSSYEDRRTAGFQEGYMGDSAYRFFLYKPDESVGRPVVIRGEMEEEPSICNREKPTNVIGARLGVNLADNLVESLENTAKEHNVGVGGGYALAMDKGRTCMEFYLGVISESEKDYLEEVDNFYKALCEMHKEISSKPIQTNNAKYERMQMPVWHH